MSWVHVLQQIDDSLVGETFKQYLIDTYGHELMKFLQRQLHSKDENLDTCRLVITYHVLHQSQQWIWISYVLSVITPLENCLVHSIITEHPHPPQHDCYYAMILRQYTYDIRVILSKLRAPFHKQIYLTFRLTLPTFILLLLSTLILYLRFKHRELQFHTLNFTEMNKLEIDDSDAWFPGYCYYNICQNTQVGKLRRK